MQVLGGYVTGQLYLGLLLTHLSPVCLCVLGNLVSAEGVWREGINLILSLGLTALIALEL